MGPAVLASPEGRCGEVDQMELPYLATGRFCALKCVPLNKRRIRDVTGENLRTLKKSCWIYKLSEYLFHKLPQQKSWRQHVGMK
ncbi:hypothetical protein AV530_001614 [Patagioenas fasciata monilis]|uniref:Uncharacterized protein n=1 Tax=Patagioenas fasciata monilis TaxID=372326 RepID=A0A1V4K4U5_PATFA|nr:hypothetical protein AV530_001614 [Patagioenas fasciata monilis]